MSKEYKTIEHASHGETYQHAEGTYTVYAIGTYRGQQSRRFIDVFESEKGLPAPPRGVLRAPRGIPYPRHGASLFPV